MATQKVSPQAMTKTKSVTNAKIAVAVLALALAGGLAFAVAPPRTTDTSQETSRCIAQKQFVEQCVVTKGLRKESGYRQVEISCDDGSSVLLGNSKSCFTESDWAYQIQKAKNACVQHCAAEEDVLPECAAVNELAQKSKTQTCCAGLTNQRGTNKCIEAGSEPVVTAERTDGFSTLQVEAGTIGATLVEFELDPPEEVSIYELDFTINAAEQDVQENRAYIHNLTLEIGGTPSRQISSERGITENGHIRFSIPNGVTFDRRRDFRIYADIDEDIGTIENFQLTLDNEGFTEVEGTEYGNAFDISPLQSASIRVQGHEEPQFIVSINSAYPTTVREGSLEHAIAAFRVQNNLSVPVQLSGVQLTVQSTNLLSEPISFTLRNNDYSDVGTPATQELSINGQEQTLQYSTDIEREYGISLSQKGVGGNAKSFILYSTGEEVINNLIRAGYTVTLGRMTFVEKLHPTEQYIFVPPEPLVIENTITPLP